jgi:hypothetical protein
MSSPGDDDPLLLWLRHRSLDSLHARLVENGYTCVAFLIADDTLDREALKDMGVKRGHQAPLLLAIAAEKQASTAAASAPRCPPGDGSIPLPLPEEKGAATVDAANAATVTDARGVSSGDSPATQRELFFLFTWIFLDPGVNLMPAYPRRAFRERWDGKYAVVLGGETWEGMAPARRGSLCWEGDEERTVELPGSATVTAGKPGKMRSAKVDVTHDLTLELRHGDRIRIGDTWCRLVSQEGHAVTWNAKKQTGQVTLDVPLGGLPATSGPFDMHRQVIKSECVTRMDKKMVRPFKEHITSGRDDEWEYSLLVFLLTKSSHELVDPTSPEGKAVDSMRVLRNEQFAHVASCRMRQEDFDAACATMRGFVGTLFNAAVLAEFNKQIDAVMQTRVFTGMPEAAAQKLWEAPFAAFLREKMDDKRGRRDDGTFRFTGRDWIFDEVRAWLAEDGGAAEGAFLITGGAGIGKSAFVAESCATTRTGV